MLLTGVFWVQGQCSVSAVFSEVLVFFLSDVIDGDFKAVILKDNALHGKRYPFLSMFNDIRFSPLPILSRLLVFVMKRDVAKFGDAEDFFQTQIFIV